MPSVFVTAMFLLLSGPVTAHDWPQWRGPARDGVAANIQLPDDWLHRDLTVRWRIPLGEGYATPLIWGDTVFTFGREQSSEVIQAHASATGKVLWRTAYPANYEAQDLKGAHGAGPRATPLVHDQRLFTFGINEVLTCVDIQTGRLLWRVDFPHRFGTQPPGYGASSSPLIDGRRLIVPAGNRIFSLDYRSGSVVWNAASDSFYSSIIASELAGSRQLVAFTRYRLTGCDPANGRLLWSMRYPSLFGSNITTPVVWKDRVIVSSSSQGTRAVRVIQRDGHYGTAPVWHTKSFRAYLSSPVVHDSHLYGLDEGGMLFCLDLENGRVVWSGGDFSDFGTIVLVGNQLLILSGYGELTAVQATPQGYRELGQRQVAESATWAHLVLARDSMLVRDKKQLTCFELKGKLK